MKRNLIFALAALWLMPLAAQNPRILIGTLTEGTASEGIYLYSFDSGSAQATLLDTAPAANPTFLTISDDGTRVYSVNEFHDGRQGVSSFTLGPDGISPLNSLSIPMEAANAGDPCNILWLPGVVVTSNYTGGSVTAFPLNADGTLNGMSQAFSCEESPAVIESRMHCAVLSPEGKYIFVTNLGLDCIHRFVRGEKERPLGKDTVAWKEKSRAKFGPRHMVFSDDGRFAYLLCELGDKLVVFSYDDGELTPIQTLTAYKGRGRGSADIHLSPDGRFLYTSHRLRGDGISIFSVDGKTGKVKRAGFCRTGVHPRNFAISPEGRFLLCACRDSDRVEIYSRDPVSGTLTPTGKSIGIDSPMFVRFL